jgi:nicotinate phosphoribosyltransferase
MNFNTKDIELQGLDNGSEFFANEKILLLKGNLSYIALLIPGIKSIISFPTLVCTNSIRMRKIAGDKVSMLEFGLRRAQGPMAGNLASKYSFMGSFNGILFVK